MYVFYWLYVFGVVYVFYWLYVFGVVYVCSEVNNREESSEFIVGGLTLDREDSRKARMLYDYDATNDDEITINSQEVSSLTFCLCDAKASRLLLLLLLNQKSLL